MFRQNISERIERTIISITYAASKLQNIVKWKIRSEKGKTEEPKRWRNAFGSKHTLAC